MTALGRRVERNRRRRGRGDRGAVMVEFAFVTPVLILLVFGIIDFGSLYSDNIAVRQGTREAARQGAVANFGSGGCQLTGATGSADIQNLMCVAKTQMGLDQTQVRVKILIADTGLTATDQSWTTNNNLILCTQLKAKSLSGVFSTFLTSTYLKSKTVIRIEQSSPSTEKEGSETAPTGSNWSWCNLEDASP